MKVKPFINTVCSINYKRFILKEFNQDMLKNIGHDKAILDNWHGRDMGGWFSFVNVANTANLDFYDDHYIIKPHKLSPDSYKLPLPLTLSDFINDTYRCGVELNWCKDVVDGFEDFNLLGCDEIENYYDSLLIKIGKNETINSEK